ncbi:MAG: A/G-specific adenine glycosylase [Azospirillaceae bacterium]|nr:A/G-specific adenine glycosylase [Azospirillaceae bacterium]
MAELALSSTSAPQPTSHDDLPDRLLVWYDHNRRVLPWRVAPGLTADPYRIWLSEIMLQQTTTVTVAGYYQDFLARWPTVDALAAAPLDAVLQAWAGLGYYARARNLHKCAQAVVNQHRGRFPDTEAALRDLPGIGAYTAAAIAAIAFDRAATVVDGNVERVIARLFQVEQPLPAAKPALRALAATLTPATRPGDYAQALMDLGATVCVPRQPRCMLCPWQQACVAQHNGTAAQLPHKLAKAEKPTRRGVAYWLTDRSGAVLLRRRSETGLLGGMMEIPSTEWRSTALPSATEIRRQSPVPHLDWHPVPGLVLHSFTHFDLELAVVSAVADHGAAAGLWVALDQLGQQALPTVMRKVVRHALAARS